MSAPLVALTHHDGVWALAPAARGFPRGPVDVAALREIEVAEHPRWVWWTADTARDLVGAGIRATRAWDLSAVHRILSGGWRADPARIWATARGLPDDDLPGQEEPNLFAPATDHDPTRPIRDDGHLAPEWAQGRWTLDTVTLATWAELALDVLEGQRRQLVERVGSERSAHAESAAALLCAELEHDGLPVDREVAEQLIAEFIGPRPRDAAEEAERARERDAVVLAHAEVDVDLRNPGQVRSLLRRVGIEVPDTRAWRLEEHRDEHPVVEALLRWRKAERIATTFGYRWLDQHVGNDGRLHGSWTPSDGAAGRMTATAGLHNLPALLRPAIVAEPGHLFIRADLGQIEPRVLAAVSADPALIRASREDDLYLPVASRLGVTRDVAKVAVLGAMYGQTTGHGAAALAGLEREYPQAMRVLTAADEAAQGGHDLFTVGGRRIRMSASVDATMTERAARSRAAARGRFGRNAVIQGAAAELFKTWAALVRAGAAPRGGRIVMCLHDELLVHVPERHAAEIALMVTGSLSEIADLWGPAAAADVRFVADVQMVKSWAEAR